MAVPFELLRKLEFHDLTDISEETLQRLMIYVWKTYRLNPQDFRELLEYDVFDPDEYKDLFDHRVQQYIKLCTRNFLNANL